MNCHTIAITGGTIVNATNEIHGQGIIIRNGKIERFTANSDPLPDGCLRIPADGLRIVPGLIDTHVCGGAGFDCRQGAEAIISISNCLVKHGITAWLPTFYSIPSRELPNKIASVARIINNVDTGATIMGFHLEGPYFVSVRRGIARDEDLSIPDPVANRAFLEQYSDLIRLVTLSPEMEGIIPLIEQFAHEGIVVAAGHTAANKQHIQRARDAGLRHVTHIFNAMDDRGWVQAGVVKTGSCDFFLLDDALTASLIGDGVHVLPEIVQLVLRVKGVDKTIAITDLWPGAGWDGREMTYITGEEVIVADDAMRMKTDNQLAGGTTFLNRCVHNLMTFANLTWPEAVRIGCLNPARLLGVDHRKGNLKEGMDADILVVDDNWNPHYVIVNGKIVHNNTCLTSSSRMRSYAEPSVQRPGMKTTIISAIPTPLNSEGNVHVEGLRAHLEEQLVAGISGILVGGTMGLMQLLSDATYRQLVNESARYIKGRVEVLVGVGDTSFVRTLDKIHMVEEYDIDGVVVLDPFFIPFDQSELIDYYQALAEASRKPLYAYHLPVRTGVTMTVDTAAVLSKHPNIRGIKCSVDFSWTRQLMNLVPDSFRVIVSQPMCLDVLIRAGIYEHLDGIFSLAPQWTMDIAVASERGEHALAAQRQARLAQLLNSIVGEYPVFAAFGAILNARGIQGNFLPAPMQPLRRQQIEQLLEEQIIKELLQSNHN